MTESHVWKMRDGSKIKVSKMADSHLLNCRNMMLRIADVNRSETLSCSLIFQGEMASYYAEQEWEKACEMTLEQYAEEMFGSKWLWIQEEIKKRGIKWKD